MRRSRSEGRAKRNSEQGRGDTGGHTGILVVRGKLSCGSVDRCSQEAAGVPAGPRAFRCTHMRPEPEVSRSHSRYCVEYSKTRLRYSERSTNAHILPLSRIESARSLSIIKRFTIPWETASKTIAAFACPVASITTPGVCSTAAR